MPLYDIRCSECDGIFEKMLSVSSLHSDIDCPYCGQSTLAVPMMTGGKLFVNVMQSWSPSSAVEALTGAPAAGPGAYMGAKRSSVLHACSGMNCSLCK